MLNKIYETDDLTHAYNRRFLKEYLKIESKKYSRYRRPFSILLLDLDHFKEVNDSRGHLEGDKVLKEFSSYLRENLRDSDILARYGGDEFVIVLTNTERNAALIAGKRIIENMKNRKPFSDYNVGVSAGLAQFPDDGKDLGTLLKVADSGLYNAKRLGRGRIYYAGEKAYKPIIPSVYFVNRQSELENIRNWITEDKSMVIFIEGDVGVGKSRLLFEVTDRLNIFTVRASAFGTTIEFPYYIVREILNDLYYNNKSLFKKVFDSLDNTLKYEIAKFVIELSADVQFTDKEGPDRHTLYYAVLKFFETMNNNKPMIFALDDMQWIDKQSADLLHFLLHSYKGIIKIVGSNRITEIGTGFDYFIGLLESNIQIKKLSIKNLNESNTHVLIKSILGDYIEDTALSYITKMSGGNPFFTEEIIGSLYESGDLTLNDAEQWTMPKNPQASDIKTLGIESTVNRKIRSLSEKSKNVLEFISLFGDKISTRTLVQLTGLGEGEIYDALDDLIAKGFLKNEGDILYNFTAGITRNVVASQIPKGRAFQIHKSTLKYFMDIEGEVERNEKSYLIAYHYREIGKKKEAAYYLLKAAKKAKSLYSFKEAVDFLKESISLNKTIEAQEELSDTYYSLGKFEEAAQLYREIINENKDKEDKMLLSLADVYDRMDKNTEARDILTKLIEKASDDNLKNDATRILAWNYYKTGNVERAISIYRELLDKTDRDSEIHTRVLHELSICYRRTGDFDRALLFCEQALDSPWSQNNEILASVIKLALSSIYLHTGKIDEALFTIKEAIKQFESKGLMYYYLTSLINLSAILLAKQELEDAQNNLLRAEQLAILMNQKNYLSYIYANLSYIAESYEEFDRALSYIDNSINYAKESQSEYEYMASIADKIGVMIKLKGCNKEVKNAISQVENFLKADNNIPDFYTFTTYLKLIEPLLNCGKKERAGQIIEKLKGLKSSVTDVFEIMNYYIVSSFYNLDNKNVEEARHYLNLAEKVLEDNYTDRLFVLFNESKLEFYKKINNLPLSKEALKELIEFYNKRNAIKKLVILNKKLAELDNKEEV